MQAVRTKSRIALAQITGQNERQPIRHVICYLKQMANITVVFTGEF
jgi:hypothetical protein